MAEHQWLADVYATERDTLVLIAWNILRRHDAAEDAVHAAFASMIRLQNVPQDPRLYTFRCVRNAAIDQKRSMAHRYQEQSIEATDDRALSYRSSEPPDEGLMRVMDRLPPAARETVELHLHGGLTFREIGELTNTPTQTVATRYRRTLKSIRRTLEVSVHE